MEQNGICFIKVKGIEYPLYFNRMAIQEVAMRTEAATSPNDFKVTVDLVYGGMCAYNYSKDLPYPKFSDVYQIVEDFYEEEDCVEQLSEINKCFVESKYGKEYLSAFSDIKKKLSKLKTKSKKQPQPSTG